MSASAIPLVSAGVGLIGNIIGGSRLAKVEQGAAQRAFAVAEPYARTGAGAMQQALARLQGMGRGDGLLAGQHAEAVRGIKGAGRRAGAASSRFWGDISGRGRGEQMRIGMGTQRALGEAGRGYAGQARSEEMALADALMRLSGIGVGAVGPAQQALYEQAGAKRRKYEDIMGGVGGLAGTVGSYYQNREYLGLLRKAIEAK